MARTTQEWHDYVSSLMPGWHQGRIENAIKAGIGKVFQNLELDIANTLAETYLTNATGSRLDQLGHERGVERLLGESDPTYRGRIRSFTGVTRNAIMAAINSAIAGVVGEDSGIEYRTYELMDQTFLNHEFVGDVFPAQTGTYNLFQIEFSGTPGAIDKTTLYNTTIASVDKAKAFGVLYNISSSL